MKKVLLGSSIALMCSGAFVFTAPAHADTLISDQFNRTGLLNGSSPTFTVATGPGKNWVADPSMTTNGSAAQTSYNGGNSGTTGYLAIPNIGTAAIGSTYTLSFSMPQATDPTNSDHGWGAAGFGVITNTASFPYNVGQGNEDSFMILYNPEGLWVIYSDQNLLASGQSASPILTATLSLTLGAGGVDSLAAIVNGSPVTNLSSSTMNLPVSEVFYGNTVDPTSISNFVLTGPAAVPEPATWAMMMGGLAMLGFCIRRKSA